MQSYDLIQSSQSPNHILVVLRALLGIYIAVTVPLRFAFIPNYRVDTNSYAVFMILDLLCGLFYILDAIYIFCHEIKLKITPEQGTFNATAKSHLSTERLHTLRKNQYRFISSFLSCLPLEYVTLSNLGRNISANYLLFNKFLRVFYLPKYMEDLSVLLEMRGTIRSKGLQRAWKLFFIMALAGHWCCCGFYFVAKIEAMHGMYLTWVEDLDLIQATETRNITLTVDVSEAYIQALYWAYITMITTGFGDIVPLSIPETVWCIITMALGVMITACAIANLQLVVTNVDAALTNFQRKIGTISKYMRYRRLPVDLQNRVTSFYHYQWDLLRGADEEKFLSELPKSLQQQVSNFMCRDLIASLPVLRKANMALLNALADCAEINIYSPGDDIIKPGEQIRGTLLVSRGEVEVLNKSRIERKMKRCDTFAEESLFIKRICEKNVRAKTFSEVFMIPSEAFQQIVEAQCDKNLIQEMKDIALTISKNSKKANKLFGSGEDSIPMNKARRHFHPSSVFRAIWDVCSLVGYLFYIFSLPLMVMRFLDGETLQDNLTGFVVSYVIDLFFVMSLYLRFNCFMFYEEGLVVFDRDRIRERFRDEHSLSREIIVSVPFDLLGLVFDSRICFLLRLVKLFRLPQILKHIDYLNRHLSDYRLGGDLVLFKVITLNFVLLIVCHWVGTLWHGCADLGEQLGYFQNWREMDEGDETLSISHSDLGGFGAYLRSVYWAIVGMSTVGYGDIVPTNILETTFATVIILFGGLILPAVVGGLAAYLGSVNLTKKMYKRKLAMAKSFMRHYAIDKALVNKVIRFYDYLWSRQDAIDEESIMNELPWPLRQQVAMHLHRKTIDAVPFFSSCEDSVKDLIVSILKPRIFMPLDTVIHKGEIGTSMYFIEKGEVAIVNENGMAYCVLENGDYFGESSLISSTVLTSSAKALTYCDVFVLQKEDFTDIMEEFFPATTQRFITKLMIETMNKKLTLNKNISQNLVRRPKCGTLVSMIDTTQVKRGEFGRMKGTTAASTRNVVFYADSKFFLLWNIIVVFICIYNAWIVPFRLTFTTNISYWVDWIFDCLLVVDMYLNYSKFGFLHEGEVIGDVERVRRRYISTRFKLDLISTLPYDVFYSIIAGPEKSSILMASFRVSRLFRIIRLPQLLSDIFNILDDTDISLAPLRLVEFLSGVILIAHYAACGWMCLALWKNDESACAELDGGNVLLDWGNAQTECRWRNTWVQRQIMDGKIPYDGGTVWQRYIRSFNWALPTLVVVVIGDVVPVTSHETLYAFVWMILGVTINAAIIGNVANIVANIDTDSSAFVKRADEIKKYMHNSRISEQLRSRVNYFLTSLWDHRESQNEDQFLSELPSTLQIQVTQRTRQRHISECPFFDFCSHEIVKALGLRLKLLLFSKHDIIVHQGDMGQEMFFLEKGSVEIVSDDGKTTFATLEANPGNTNSENKESAFFGETSLFFKRKRTNTVRAITFCEVYQLHKRDLDRELRRRDFDLRRMLQVFTKIADSNKKRNSAVARNLALAKSKNSKLFKIVDTNNNIDYVGRKISAFLIPNTNFRKGWDSACSLLTIYIAVCIPFRAAFCYEDLSERFPTWLIFDFSIDAFFIVDLCFRYFIFPVTHNGAIITEAEQIRLRYKQSGMVFDILACLPIEFFALFMGIDYLLRLRLVHMIRIVQFPRYFEQVETYLNIYNFRVDAAKKLLLKMFFFYALVNHWCACIWFSIHRFFQPNIKYTWATTDCPGGDNHATDGCLSVWVEEKDSHNICDGDVIRRCYLRSFYFVLTTTSTVGYGDISPVTELETIFQNIVVLIGACFLAGLIGSFAEYLSHNDQSGQSAYETKVQKLQDYMNYRNLPHQLQKEILFFHHHKWMNSHSLDEKAVISILPVPLQMDLSFEILRPLIHQFPILTETHTIIQKRIAHALNRQVCPTDTIIYNAGDIGWDIYLVGSGLVQLSLPTNLQALDEEGRANFQRVKERAESVGLLYRPGNHFGESCLISHSGVRQETTITKTKTTLYFISKDNLDYIFGFMAKEDSRKLTNNIISRNGNVWHSFNDDLNQFSASASTSTSFTQPVRSPSYIRNKSERFTILQAQRSRRSLVSNEKQKSQRKARLRSFSAEASAQAIRIQSGKFVAELKDGNGARKKFSVPRSNIEPLSKLNEDPSHSICTDDEEYQCTGNSKENSSDLSISIPSNSWDPGDEKIT